MNQQQSELQGQLMAAAEEAMAAVLDWDSGHPQSDFGEIEALMLRIRKRLGEQMTAALVESHMQRRPVPGPRCPECGREMHYKGDKPLGFGSLVGDIAIERGYYYCTPCERGLFPLDEQLDLPEQHWSAGVVRRVTWLSGRLSYGEVCEVLAEQGDVPMGKSTAWGLVQTWGARLGAEVAAEETAVKAAAREWSTPGGPPEPQARLGVAVDGAMLYILHEGWKELKVGSIFDLEMHRERDPRTGDGGEYGHAVNLSYTAHLGGPAACGWQVWTEAHRRGWHQAPAGLVAGDGAAWIWNLRDEHFPDSETVVDWYHATEHLGTAKQLLYPEDGPAATRWYYQQELLLYQGHAHQVAQTLTQAAQAHPDATVAAALQTESTYFHHQHAHMQYQELREAGWPIGSGMVESAAKQFKHRFTGPGMRWSRQGAENLLPVRAAVMTSKARFDDLWTRACLNSPQN